MCSDLSVAHPLLLYHIILFSWCTTSHLSLPSLFFSYMEDELWHVRNSYQPASTLQHMRYCRKEWKEGDVERRSENTGNRAAQTASCHWSSPLSFSCRLISQRRPRCSWTPQIRSVFWAPEWGRKSRRVSTALTDDSTPPPAGRWVLCLVMLNFIGPTPWEASLPAWLNKREWMCWVVDGIDWLCAVVSTDKGGVCAESSRQDVLSWVMEASVDMQEYIVITTVRSKSTPALSN